MHHVPMVAVGLSEKDFQAFLDRQLCGEPNHIEQYLQMNDYQKSIIQEVKKSIARIKYKLEH